jgi:predicted MFS family arabinose efflux permease
MPDRLGLLREPAYRAFWIGQSISFVGSHVTELALPLTAVIVLDATPEQMGLLTAIGYVPFLLIGLLAGVWVDRMRRRPILIATDLVSAAAIALIPAAAVVDVLGMGILYGVAFVFGVVEVIAPVAYQSFMPTLVGRGRLVEGSAKLEASHSVASIVGPSLGGYLVQVLTAPIALLVDSVSYLVSAGTLASIRVAEPPPLPRAEEATIRRQIGEGLRLVTATPILRSLVACGSIHNFFSRMIDALFVLYAVDSVGLSPVDIGLVLAAGGPGALIGATVVERAGRMIGVGRVIVVSQVLTGISRLLVPIAGIVGGGAAAIIVLAASTFLLGLVRVTFNITQVSLRVAITEDRMHGRVNATMRFVMWGVTPFGALAGGLLAVTALGIEGTLVLAGIGVLTATVPLLVPALRSVRDIPAHG